MSLKIRKFLVNSGAICQKFTDFQANLLPPHDCMDAGARATQEQLPRRAVYSRTASYDIHPYTKGAGKEPGLHSQTWQCIAGEYVTRRKPFKKATLNWRKSGGVRRSIGWEPVNTGQSKWKNGQVFHNGIHFSVWDDFGLGQYKFRSASFNEDAKGRWYFNGVVSVESEISEAKASAGIDPGCKASATASNGEGVTGRLYKAFEAGSGIVQRAKNKKRIKAIHAKIANKRMDLPFTTPVRNIPTRKKCPKPE